MEVARIGILQGRRGRKVDATCIYILEHRMRSLYCPGAVQLLINQTTYKTMYHNSAGNQVNR